MEALVFAADELAEIIRLRRAGATQRELGKRFYCSGQAIGKVLRQNGISGYHARKPHFPIAMIQHDWQAGTSPADIVRIYGVKEPLRNLISYYRQKGWRFDVRPRHKATY